LGQIGTPRSTAHAVYWSKTSMFLDWNRDQALEMASEEVALPGRTREREGSWPSSWKADHERERTPSRRLTTLGAGLTVVGIALLGSEPGLGVSLAVTGTASAAAATVVALRGRRDR
jgi:hypothetical protein